MGTAQDGTVWSLGTIVWKLPRDWIVALDMECH